MSKKAAAVKQWVENRKRFANLFNAKIFDGKPDLRKYIPNYTINLIDAARLDNPDVFQNDLQVIFGLLKCRKDKQKLKRYVEENKEFFSSVDADTAMAIGAFMNSDSIVNEMKNPDEGGCVDMCKAMEDWAAEEREEGRLEGRLESRLEGEENKLVEQICKKLAKGKNVAIIADEVEETEEIVKQLMEKYDLNTCC